MSQEKTPTPVQQAPEPTPKAQNTTVEALQEERNQKTISISFEHFKEPCRLESVTITFGPIQSKDELGDCTQHLDYILQLEKFREKRFERPLSFSAVVLYIEILFRFNRNGWPNELELSEKALLKLADLSENQFYSAREELVKNGYINIAEKEDKCFYSLIKLYED